MNTKAKKDRGCLSFQAVNSIVGRLPVFPGRQLIYLCKCAQTLLGGRSFVCYFVGITTFSAN